MWGRTQPLPNIVVRASPQTGTLHLAVFRDDGPSHMLAGCVVCHLASLYKDVYMLRCLCVEPLGGHAISTTPPKQRENEHRGYCEMGGTVLPHRLYYSVPSRTGRKTAAHLQKHVCLVHFCACGPS